MASNEEQEKITSPSGDEGVEVNEAVEASTDTNEFNKQALAWSIRLGSSPKYRTSAKKDGNNVTI